MLLAVRRMQEVEYVERNQVMLYKAYCYVSMSSYRISMENIWKLIHLLNGAETNPTPIG